MQSHSNNSYAYTVYANKLHQWLIYQLSFCTVKQSLHMTLSEFANRQYLIRLGMRRKSVLITSQMI